MPVLRIPRTFLALEQELRRPRATRTPEFTVGHVGHRPTGDKVDGAGVRVDTAATSFTHERGANHASCPLRTRRLRPCPTWSGPHHGPHREGRRQGRRWRLAGAAKFA